MRRRVESFARAALPSVALLATFAPAAMAAKAPVYAFQISAKSVSEALIDFAVQSNLSIGGGAVCRGYSNGLVGTYTIDEGLKRLLAGANCRFRRVAADTVRILPVARAPRAVTASGPLEPPSIEPATVVVQEVVVSATKRAAALDALPYAISALSGEDLRVAGATDIADVATQLAGLSSTNLGPGRDKILLRGLSDGVFTGRTQSTVGLYLDNVPITYNAPDPDLHLGDLDAIEILRGPQGTLYGGGSMSGIYRIVTRKPELDQWSASTRTDASLTEGGADSYQLEGVINAPILRDKTAVRAMIYQDVEGGYIDDINLHQANIDGSTRTGARGAVLIAPDPSWTVIGSTAFQSIRSNDTQYITPDLGRLHRANAVRESSSNDFAQAAATSDTITAWGDLRSTTSFVHHRFATRSDASNALPLFAGVVSSVGSYDEPSTIDMLVEDAVWTSPSTGRLQWLAGVFGSTTQEVTEAFVRANDPTGAPAQILYQEHRSDNLGEAAVYGEATLGLTKALQATLGARAFFTHVQTNSQVLAPQSGGQRDFKGGTPGTGVSPKLAVSYRLAHDQLLYASIEEGHRQGGFNTGGLIGQIFATNPSAIGVHRQFGADELWNYELGAKLAFFGGRLRVRSSVFYNSWRNIQTDQFMSSGLSYTTNAGDGTNLGLESEAEMRLTPHWSIKANVLADKPVLARPKPGFIAGVPLPGVPDLLTGGRTEYKRRLFRHWDGLLSAETRYVGRSQLTFDPRITSPMGGYFVGELSAQMIGPRWRLAAFVSNPTNEAGNTFSYGNPFNFQQVREVTPQRPRTIRVQLSADF